MTVAGHLGRRRRRHRPRADHPVRHPRHFFKQLSLQNFFRCGIRAADDATAIYCDQARGHVSRNVFIDTLAEVCSLFLQLAQTLQLSFLFLLLLNDPLKGRQHELLVI